MKYMRGKRKEIKKNLAFSCTSVFVCTTASEFLNLFIYSTTNTMQCNVVICLGSLVYWCGKGAFYETNEKKTVNFK